MVPLFTRTEQEFSDWPPGSDFGIGSKLAARPKRSFGETTTTATGATTAGGPGRRRQRRRPPRRAGRGRQRPGHHDGWGESDSDSGDHGGWGTRTITTRATTTAGATTRTATALPVVPEPGTFGLLAGGLFGLGLAGRRSRALNPHLSPASIRGRRAARRRASRRTRSGASAQQSAQQVVLQDHQTARTPSRQAIFLPSL